MEKKQGFFARAFENMKESARAQHAVDKAEFEAVKAESKANWEEAKSLRGALAKALSEEQAARIEDANRRKAEEEERIAAAKASQKEED